MVETARANRKGAMHMGAAATFANRFLVFGGFNASNSAIDPTEEVR